MDNREQTKDFSGDIVLLVYFLGVQARENLSAL